VWRTIHGVTLTPSFAKSGLLQNPLFLEKGLRKNLRSVKLLCVAYREYEGNEAPPGWTILSGSRQGRRRGRREDDVINTGDTLSLNPT
jgi:hypothetical protein